MSTNELAAKIAARINREWPPYRAAMVAEAAKQGYSLEGANQSPDDRREWWMAQIIRVEIDAARPVLVLDKCIGDALELLNRMELSNADLALAKAIRDWNVVRRSAEFARLSK